jgi:poly(glycerol-phosphate) alpha-glucosyltransferase
MKAAFLTGSLSRRAGGVFTALTRLAQSLTRDGQTVVEVIGLADEYTSDDLSAWQPVRPQVLRGYTEFGLAPGMFRSLRQVDPDIVHTHGLWMYPSIVASRWAQVTRRPHIVSPQGMLDPWALKNAWWKKRIAALAFEDAHLRRARCLHSVCEAEAHSFRTYGLRSPICIIPNGMDLPEEKSSEPPKSDPRVPDCARVLLYLGRLHPKKGLEALLQAWHTFQKTALADDWYLVIAGWDQDGYQKRLQQMCKKLELRQAVFVGPQFGKDKDAWYRRASASILPSYSEGLPLSVLEAWAYGVPVLMTEHCNLSCGFEAAAATKIDLEPESILEGLKALAGAREADRRAMGERGRVLVRERFAWPKIAADMKDVYSWVLGGGAPPKCLFG